MTRSHKQGECIFQAIKDDKFPLGIIYVNTANRFSKKRFRPIARMIGLCSGMSQIWANSGISLKASDKKENRNGNFKGMDRRWLASYAESARHMSEVFEIEDLAVVKKA